MTRKEVQEFISFANKLIERLATDSKEHEENLRLLKEKVVHEEAIISGITSAKFRVITLLSKLNATPDFKDVKLKKDDEGDPFYYLIDRNEL